MATTTSWSDGRHIGSELFRDCLPAAEGHTSAGKEVGYYLHPIAIDDYLYRWELAARWLSFS